MFLIDINKRFPPIYNVKTTCTSMLSYPAGCLRYLTVGLKSHITVPVCSFITVIPSCKH